MLHPFSPVTRDLPMSFFSRILVPAGLQSAQVFGRRWVSGWFSDNCCWDSTLVDKSLWTVRAFCSAPNSGDSFGATDSIQKLTSRPIWNPTIFQLKHYCCWATSLKRVSVFKAPNMVELVESTGQFLRCRASMWAGAWMEAGISPRFQKQGKISVYGCCAF